MLLVIPPAVPAPTTACPLPVSLANHATLDVRAELGADSAQAKAVSGGSLCTLACQPELARRRHRCLAKSGAGADARRLRMPITPVNQEGIKQQTLSPGHALVLLRDPQQIRH